MFGNRLINTNAGGGGCTDTVDLYNPFPNGGGVALYQLNGDATDVSGNYDGTATNVTYGAGEFGQAGVFNGSSSLISAPNNSLLTQTQFSVSAWVNHNSATGTRTIISNYGYTVANGESGWIIALNAGKVRVFNVVSGASYFVDSIASIPGGVFTNIAVTNTQSQVNIYINGSLDSTHSMSGFIFNLAINNYLTIGAYKYDATGSPNGKFNGSIDQVRIFSRALRPYEVEALYTEEYCTPTIVPSEHFNTVTYTGDNTANRQITDVGFQPDLVWIKGRTIPSSHVLSDSVRGVNLKLRSNSTAAEAGTDYGVVSAFSATGFSVDGTIDKGDVNNTGDNYVAWNFKAGGSAVSNTDGTITSQVSANTEAGFSVVSYTGNGANGTVGHGLGTTPNIVLTKRRNSTSNWSFNGNIGGLIYGTNKLALNDTIAISSDTNEVLAANSNNFTAGTSGSVGASGGTYVAYCFAEVEGFSNFGSYVGNGSTSGPTVVTGFEPAFIMIKNSSAIYEWVIVDNKRTIDNPRNKELNPNSSAAENGTGDPTSINFLENGFQIVSTDGATNQNNGKLIYMAFAADPTTIEPSLEDSFNTVLYTGNNSFDSNTQSITGVGFQPDFLWIKARNSSRWNVLFDSVKGSTEYLSTNNANAEATKTTGITSFDSDGFSVGTWLYVNYNIDNYVAWAWKGAEISAINSNGSIPSVVSANPAAGFSIVSWQGIGPGQSIGHGLNAVPSVIIHKRRTPGDWEVYTSTTGANQKLILNRTNAAASSTAFGNTTPTSDVYYAGGYYDPMIAYCFAEVAGFSKFGSYTGNGSTNGPTITTGFEPAFLLVKQTNGTGAWFIMDNKRSPTNPRQLLLQPASNAAEENVGNAINFNADGFQILDTNASRNASGGTYIYMAFANQF